MIEDSKYVNINSVNPSYLIFNKENDYFEEINGSKYLTLNPTKESKEKIKKYKELWSKIKDLIRSITKNSNDYDEKHMKIKLNSDEEFPLNKRIEIPSMIIVVRAIFYENNNYFPQVFLDEYLYKIENRKKENKDELKEIDIINRTCYYFDDNISLDKKLYENISVYDISYKISVGPKPLSNRFDKLDGFIRVRGDKFRHLVLFDYEMFDKIC